MRGVADGEAAVVAGAVAHVGVENVVIHGIAGAQHAIGKNVGMRVAALARDGIHRLHIFRTEIVQNFADQTDGLIFAHPGLHGAVELVVGGVNHHG